MATCPAGFVPSEENDCEATPEPTPMPTHAPLAEDTDADINGTAAPGQVTINAHVDIDFSTNKYGQMTEGSSPGVG